MADTQQKLKVGERGVVPSSSTQLFHDFEQVT